jgi:hypothetical protein
MGFSGYGYLPGVRPAKKKAGTFQVDIWSKRKEELTAI